MGNTEGRKFVVDTVFSRQARKHKIDEEQQDLIVASLLGDGYLVKTTRGFAFRVNHCPGQKEYVDWKWKFLKNLVNSPPRFAEKCYYFRTVSHPYFSELRGQFYDERVKVVPHELIKDRLNPFILAVWIMDDGSKDGGQLRINTQCFSKNENIVLKDLLRAKLEIIATLNRDKGQYRLRICGQSMPQLLRLVKPHIIPSMLYKLLP